MPARREEQDLGYVFVVTYGRSGSTLLQAILNSIPGYLIRGENFQALKHLRAFHETMRKERRKRRRIQRRDGEEVGASTPSSPFYGNDSFPVKRSLREIRRLVDATVFRPEPDTRVTGLKEIRWHDEDTAAYVEWLREAFPGARFIVNTRRLEDVAQSKWWGEDPGALDRLKDIEARILALGESLGEQSFHVHYDDYVADPAALKPLYDWLGEPFDEGVVRGVLGQRHSI